MTTPDTNRILIIDDEPEYLGWVAEFLMAQGFELDYATNLVQAIDAVTDNKKYTLILVDMNIPAPTMADLLTEPIHQKYPGLKAAITFRNQGYWPPQIIAYTVHDDDALEAELNRFDCRYVLKGRPGILKGVIGKSLQTIKKKQRH